MPVESHQAGTTSARKQAARSAKLLDLKAWLAVIAQKAGLRAIATSLPLLTALLLLSSI